MVNFQQTHKNTKSQWHFQLTYENLNLYHVSPEQNGAAVILDFYLRGSHFNLNLATGYSDWSYPHFLEVNAWVVP
jgi:hypothetical protein